MKTMTATIGNRTLEIHQDENPESPREWDNNGKMVCFHNRYTLGDKHSLTVADAKAIAADSDNIVLPLYLYDHSGITMNTTGFSCPWDSGQVGFIYASKTSIRAEHNWKKLSAKRVAKVQEWLRGEVETYDQFLRGEVYGYVLKEDGETVDSCWGFFGSDVKTNGIADHVGSDLIDALVEA